MSPVTDKTATKEAIAKQAEDRLPVRVREVSAFCWLVPVRVIRAVEDRWGFPLFHPEFSNYGSDDAAASILRGIYGATPFQIVRLPLVRVSPSYFATPIASSRLAICMA
jgi:hypothetical protein